MPIRPGGGLIVILLGLIALGAAVAWFGMTNPPGQSETGSSSSAAQPSRPGEPVQTAERQAGDPPQTPAGPSVEAPGASTQQPKAPAPGPAADAGKASGPSFDVVRIESTGDSVIAGRGTPGATIELLRDGKVYARTLADTSGLFAFVPPPLAPGAHEIDLASVAPDGTRTQSRESVTVVISNDRNSKPLVTLTSPERPTVVLSAPEPSDTRRPQAVEADVKGSQPPGPSAGPGGGSVVSAPAPVDSARPLPSGPATPPPPARPGVKIVSVEAEEGGRLFVTGNAAAGATVRLYLNDSFIAPGGTGNDGKVSFAIGQGVRPGEYRVRLDDVDPVSGVVKSRAEVAFNVPRPLTVPLPPHAEPLTGQPDLGGSVARLMHPPAADPKAPGSFGEGPVSSSDVPARTLDPGTIIVPEVTTTIVSRGDNLWRISQRIYGDGTRYTVIYDANLAQIRNPDLIYPGQIFVLPSAEPPGEAARAQP